MDRRDRFAVAEKPEDLEGTALDRREFVNILKAAGALAIAPSVAGCSSNGGGDGGGAGGGDGDGDENGDGDSINRPDEVVIARPSDADLLDPHQTTDAGASAVMSLIFDSMVVMNEGRDFGPALGQGLEFSDDGTEVTVEFNVDSGITFHNGDEFTVDDVVFTFERFLETSLIPWAVGSLQGVEKVDESHVRFNFEQPYAFFDAHTSYSSYFGILPEDLGGMSAEDFAQDPIGTGPYQLEEWVKGEQITLVRNENWETPTYDVVEAEDPPLPERIVWQVIPSSTPRVQGLIAGDVDVITPVPPQQRSQVEGSGQANLNSFEGQRITYLAPHNGLAPTNEVELRQAIAHAVDRERIVEDIFNGAGDVNYSPMPLSHPPWAGDTVLEEVGYAYDPERSRQILADAGWELNGDYRERAGEQLELSMVAANAPPSMLQTAEEIAGMLGEVGINVNLSPTQPNTVPTTMAQGETHLMLGGLGWGTPDVMQFMLASPYAGASNLQFLQDEQVDQYLNEAAKTLDADERADLYEQMQHRVMELCATVPIMTPTDEAAVRSEFSNYHYVPGSGGNIWLDMREE
jgi:peptide/nickel transport system substrate-binding protein